MSIKYKIGIINLGINNIKSLKNFFYKYGEVYVIDKNNYSIFKEIDCLIIPGNGTFHSGISYLKNNSLIDPIKKFKKKIIAICLGMQILFEESEESPKIKGLALIKGKVCKINHSKIKTPLLGWFESIQNYKNKKSYFFNNSFCCYPEDDSIILEKINSDFVDIVSLIRFKNIYALQFHPEKSSSNGFKIIDQILNEKF
tara:strand:- start:188 stop:784 length:597 start_codon:yes stop_codon:yes gene_type:complete